MTEWRRRVIVLGQPLDALTWEQALERLSQWANARESRYVCITNVHSVVTGTRDAAFGRVLQDADLVTPDGAPVAWMMRRLGVPAQQRINGPDLMWRYCEQAASRGESVFFYGGSEQTLALLQRRLTQVWPTLCIAGAISPPFRVLSDEELQRDIDIINRSGAGTVWVSLGCPKQEYWMAAQRGQVQAVMIGVGAAFDYHAGTVRRAPAWMQHSGLEWLHRLCSEPRRLWRRYLVTNSLFILGAVRQLGARLLG